MSLATPRTALGVVGGLLIAILVLLCFGGLVALAILDSSITRAGVFVLGMISVVPLVFGVVGFCDEIGRLRRIRLPTAEATR